MIVGVYEGVILALMPDSFLGIMLGSLILTVLTGVVDIYLTPYFALSGMRVLPARHRAGGAAAAGSQQLHAGF